MDLHSTILLICCHQYLDDYLLPNPVLEACIHMQLFWSIFSKGVLGIKFHKMVYETECGYYHASEKWHFPLPNDMNLPEPKDKEEIRNAYTVFVFHVTKENIYDYFKQNHYSFRTTNVLFEH